MSSNESIWDTSPRWNGRERRAGERDGFIDWSSDGIVTIHTDDSVEIIGIELNITPGGIGIAISTHEPIAVSDEVTVERMGKTRRGSVRHITEADAVLVGLQWLDGDWSDEATLGVNGESRQISAFDSDAGRATD